MKLFLAMILFSLLVSLNAYASYRETLFLCDLGISNANVANQDGVDFIQYVQNGRTLDVSGTATFSSALDKATRSDPNFNRWIDSNGMNDVSINLESDYYGSEYYLEYCYTWDRDSLSDTTTYDVTFINALPVSIPHTNFTSDIICSQKTSNGLITSTSAINRLTTTNSLNSNYVSMRCTVKFNFKENSTNIKRPHNGDSMAIDPQVTVRVQP